MNWNPKGFLVPACWHLCSLEGFVDEQHLWVIFLPSIFSLAQQGKGVMGRHRYPCQSNTQVSYMTSEVVTPSTHPTGVLPASWQPHVWTCLISTSEDLVESLLLLSCFSLSCHRSNWCLRSGRAKANAIHLHSLHIYIAQHLDQLSHFFGEISSTLLWEWYAYTHAKMFLFLMTAAVKMKQALSAMRHFRSHLNKRGFPLPYFPFPWEDDCCMKSHTGMMC